MSQRAAAAIAWGFALVLLGGASIAGQQGVVRSRVEGVRVDVTVTEGGSPVLGLTAADFEVLDNNVTQSIESSRSTESVTAVLTLDTSASVAFGRLEFRRVLRRSAEGLNQLVAAGRAIVAALSQADEAALLSFSDRLMLIVPPTHDLTALDVALSARERLQPPVPQVRSTVSDAVFAAAAIASSRAGRPIVFLLSDGTDNASWLSQGHAIAALRRAGVSVDVVSVPRTYDTLDEDPPGSWDIERLADNTGGKAFSARDDRLASKMKERLAVLRSGYVLTYTPAGVDHSDGWHKLTVRLRRGKGRVEARPGYYTPGR